MWSTVAKVLGIISLVGGLTLGPFGSLSFAVFAIDQGAAERCYAIEAPPGAVGPSEESIVNAVFSRLPRGFSCTWDVGDGFLTQQYPRWDLTAYEFTGYPLAMAGVATLFVRRMVRPRPAVVVGSAA